MDTLSELFSGLWERLDGTAWYQHVQWPFWTFLILIAVGGVYNARFQKNTLFCRGITGALKLSLIYLCSFGLYLIMPGHMSTVSQLPFLHFSGSSATLVNPLGLLDRPFGAIAETLVRLYLLLFLINACGSFDYYGRNPLSWLGSQVLSCGIAWVAYELVSFGVAIVLAKLHVKAPLFYTIIAVLLLVVLFILLLMKLYFIVFRKSGNPAYGKVMKFLTAQKFGALFSVTFFSILSVLIFLVVVNLYGIGRIALSKLSIPAYVLILTMCLATLYVFSLYYTERKSE